MGRREELERIRDAAMLAAGDASELEWQAMLVGVATGIQLALHGDLGRFLAHLELVRGKS